MALWSVVRIRPDSAQPVAFQFPQIDFYNGTKYPFVAQHLILSPIGYTLQRYDTAPALSAVTYRNVMAALLTAKARFTAPGRKHFSRLPVTMGGYRPRPTGIAKPGEAYQSSLLGLSSWRFNFPNGEGMVLPRLNQVAFDLSGYTFPNVGLFAPNVDQSFVKAHAMFYERSDSFWGGTARWSGALPIRPKVLLPGQPDDIFPATPPPVYADGYGFAVPPVNGGNQQNLTFDKQGEWNHKRWATEEANVGTDWDRFCGFSVMLDQIDLDEYMQESATAGVAGNPLAPLSQRVAVSARTLAGGTGEDWWEPGCPLSLVCPTINEAAVVHDFDDPISLDTNAGLRVDLETPGAFIQDQTVFPGIYNIGVSVVGYRIVET